MEIKLFCIENEDKTCRQHYDVTGFCKNDNQKYTLELISW